jgi:hypothetical protein
MPVVRESAEILIMQLYEWQRIIPKDIQTLKYAALSSQPRA